jgi:glycosyltransferase involved in cell wall biosynthesis
MAPVPVLFIDHADALGGAEKILLLLMECLDRDRFAPHLVAPPGVLAAAARQAGVAVHEMGLARLRGKPTAPWRLLRTVVPLVQLVRREGIAVVCPHSARASVYAALAARLARRALLWHAHEPGPSALYRRLMCVLSDATIAVSAALAADLPCRRKVRVIHNGIRWADFAGDHRQRGLRLRAAWGVPRDAVLVGQVARLQPWKGQHDVVAAAELLLRDHPDVYVAIIGGDIFGDAAAYEQQLKARVAASDQSQRLLLTGHQEDVPAVLAALDVLVHGSAAEPFGTILLEAGAAGVPIVAYSGGGVAELLTHEVTALLVPQGDRAGLAAALARLVAHPDLRRALGDAARMRVRQQFDIGRMTDEVQDVLANLVRSRIAARR